MYHSITFSNGSPTLDSHSRFIGTNTWDDWHLIPSSRPVVASPGVTTNMVSIPGREGSLDMSEYLTGGIIYGDRSGSWEFYVDNDHESWITVKNKIMDFLHGKKLKCVLEDDPGYYYEGRFTLNEWRSEATNSIVVINYVVGPYKTFIDSSSAHLYQLWDPFNFEMDTFGEGPATSGAISQDNPERRL